LLPQGGASLRPSVGMIWGPGSSRKAEAGAQLSPAEHAALIVRLDTKPTKDDWVRYNAWLESWTAF